MKNTYHQIIMLLFCSTIFTSYTTTQNCPTSNLPYAVNKIRPAIPMTKEKLAQAQTLTDLNPHYEAAWIDSYIGVEILASYQGKVNKALGQNDTISQAQKDLMNQADVGTDIVVKVKYLPKNTLKYNEPKEINFSFMIEPEKDAQYQGGQEALLQYLKEKAISKIPDGSVEKKDIAVIKFTINEAGEVVQANLFWSCENEQIDTLLLETIRNMSCWKPATYANGHTIKQEFALTVGNMESCVVNLISGG